MKKVLKKPVAVSSSSSSSDSSSSSSSRSSLAPPSDEESEPETRMKASKLELVDVDTQPGEDAHLKKAAESLKDKIKQEKEPAIPAKHGSGSGQQNDKESGEKQKPDALGAKNKGAHSPTAKDGPGKQQETTISAISKEKVTIN